MRFQIENRTKYRTRDIRAFLVRSYKVACEFAGPRRVESLESWKTTIRVSFARSNRRGERGTTGHAWHGGRAHVGVGDSACKRDFAFTIAHELGHVFGMSHADMNGGALYIGGAETLERWFAWADQLPLAVTTPKRTTPTERTDTKRAALAERLARWEAKERRAHAAVKRLTVKLRDFDRRQARKAPTSELLAA